MSEYEWTLEEIHQASRIPVRRPSRVAPYLVIERDGSVTWERPGLRGLNMPTAQITITSARSGLVSFLASRVALLEAR